MHVLLTGAVHHGEEGLQGSSEPEKLRRSCGWDCPAAGTLKLIALTAIYLIMRLSTFQSDAGTVLTRKTVPQLNSPLKGDEGRAYPR